MLSRLARWLRPHARPFIVGPARPGAKVSPDRFEARSLTRERKRLLGAVLEDIQAQTGLTRARADYRRRHGIQ